MTERQVSGHATLNAALNYCDRGYSVIPIAGEGDKKRPLVKWREFQDRTASKDEIRSWFDMWPNANIGIVTGLISGIIVVDSDGPEGEASTMPFVDGISTLTARTGGGGRHRLFRHPGVPVPTRAKLYPGLDVRGDGGYIVAPPSRHASGGQYEWENEAPIVQMPTELLALVTGPMPSQPTVLYDQPLVVVEGRRNQALTKQAGRLLRSGLGHEAVLRQCLEWNLQTCLPPLHESEVTKTVRSIADREGRKPTASSAGAAPIAGRAISRVMSDVPELAIEWLWPGYIPYGQLTMLDGDPGLGKSLVTLHLASRVSRGLPLPDGWQCAKGGVVLLNGEDGAGTTIRPRLIAMDADLGRILTIDGMPDGDNVRPTELPRDIGAVEREVASMGAKLLVIDPFMAFLGGEVNSWNDHDVRRAMLPVYEMAKRTGAAVVVVRHLNKRKGESAIHRGGGSIGIVGAARSALLIAKDPQDIDGRILVSVKSNLAERPDAWAFHIEPGEHGGARVCWDRPTDVDADSLLSSTGHRVQKSNSASGFLIDALKEGPIPALQVQAMAEEAGVSKRTLDRAKRKLGVVSVRRDFGAGGYFEWSLPERPVKLAINEVVKETNSPSNGMAAEHRSVKLAINEVVKETNSPSNGMAEEHHRSPIHTEPAGLPPAGGEDTPRAA